VGVYKAKAEPSFEWVRITITSIDDGRSQLSVDDAKSLLIKARIIFEFEGYETQPLKDEVSETGYCGEFLVQGAMPLLQRVQNLAVRSRTELALEIQTIADLQKIITLHESTILPLLKERVIMTEVILAHERGSVEP